MGFFENWISDKVSAAFGRGTGMLQPVPAGGPPLQAREKAPQSAPVPSSDAKLRKAAAELMGGHDFTAKPTIDPSVLQTIMPRDGNASLTVSGLDGVLTVGKDMVMTTDQPIRCETIRVLGTLEATVYARKIIIAEGGSVIGSVRTNEAEVRGEFDGSMQVKGKVSFYPRSKISGKIRALDLAISAESNTNDADIKRVVPRIFEDDEGGAPAAGFEEGYSSMHITVSQKSALRR